MFERSKVKKIFESYEGIERALLSRVAPFTFSDKIRFDNMSNEQKDKLYDEHDQIIKKAKTICIEKLKKIGPKVIPLLIETYEKDDFDQKFISLKALSIFSDIRVNQIMEVALKSHHSEIRSIAFNYFNSKQKQTSDDEIVFSLLDLFKSDDDDPGCYEEQEKASRDIISILKKSKNIIPLAVALEKEINGSDTIFHDNLSLFKTFFRKPSASLALELARKINPWVTGEFGKLEIMEEDEWIDKLNSLADAYTKNDKGKISEIELSGRIVGYLLNEKGGKDKMLEIYNKLNKKPGLRSIESLWDGIGTWRG